MGRSGFTGLKVVLRSAWRGSAPLPALARSPGAPVPFLFRQGTRESGVDG
jgi:hypothetical protein